MCEFGFYAFTKATKIADVAKQVFMQNGRCLVHLLFDTVLSELAVAAANVRQPLLIGSATPVRTHQDE